MTTPTPIYTSENIERPAYHLRYTWTGWPSNCEFPDRPDTDEFWQTLDAFWESDGMRRLEGNWSNQTIQFTFSAKPNVSPTEFVARVKGRLQCAMRQHGAPTKFSRKVSFRTTGKNRRTEVEQYIQSQVSKEPLVDSRFAERLQQFTTSDPTARLDEPTKTLSGRYWYNLHVVLVTEKRMRFADSDSLTEIFSGCRVIATGRDHRLGELSVMPDHVHLALRASLDASPESVALQFLNNLAYRFGQNPIFRFGYYVGSFGEYDMDAVRRS